MQQTTTAILNSVQYEHEIEENENFCCVSFLVTLHVIAKLLSNN